MKTIKMIMDVPIDVYTRFVLLNLGTPLNEVLDKIRAEIEQYQSDFDEHGTEYDRTAWQAYNRCLKIIDKYREEQE